MHDVLSAVSFARNALGAKKVHLVGLGGAGHWVLAARAQAGAAIDRAAADTAGFRFAGLTAIDDPDFLPGGAKYLDLPGIAALSAPLPLWLAGEPPAGHHGHLGRLRGRRRTAEPGQVFGRGSAARDECRGVATT